MKDFESQLDEIRVKLYEETKDLTKEDVIKKVNSNCKKIAKEFGIKIKHDIKEKQLSTVKV